MPITAPILLLLPVVQLPPPPCSSVRLVPADVAPADLFGCAVDTSGDLACVGAWLQDVAEPSNPSCNSGAVYLFREQGPGAWTELAKLAPAQGNCRDYFGTVLDLEEGRVLVGAPGFVRGTEAVGAAYVFEEQGGSWVEVARLLAPDGEDNDDFGGAVALSGDWAAVGAVGVDFPGANGSGAVYLFQRVSGSWTFHGRLTPTVPDPAMAFGGEVAFGGHGELRLAVGSTGDAELGDFTGAVWVFREEGGTWPLDRKLGAPDARWGDRFGGALAYEGRTLVIGAADRDGDGQEDRGAVYVARDDGAGLVVQTEKLVAPDAMAEARFGTSLSMHGPWLVAGAGFDDELGPLTGAAYLFEKTSAGAYRFVTRLRPDGLAGGDFIGSTLALRSDDVLLGARGTDTHGAEAGLTHVLGLPPKGVEVICVCAPLSPCGNFEEVDGCTNSTGLGATLDLAGGASSAELVLCAGRMPPGQPAVLTLGAPGTSLPFGDGVRCLGSPLLRSPTRATDSGGRAVFGPGLAHLVDAIPGTTRGFQVLYRDPGGPCAAGWNATRALAFVPAP